MYITYTIVICLVISVKEFDCARILAVFPTPSISHQVVFRTLTQELARRGHEVTVLTTDPAFQKGKSPSNLTEIDVHDLSYNIWRREILKTATGEKDNQVHQMAAIYKAILPIFEAQVQTEEFQKIIHDNRKFDLIILEAWVRPALALIHIFKAPCILMSSLGRVFYNYETMGAPEHPLLYPICLRRRLYNLTLWEKITEIYDNYNTKSTVGYIDEEYNDMIRRNFGNDVPSLKELSNNVDMMFLNMHPIWEGNHPVPPSVIHLWGLHKNQMKDLPQDLKEYLDSSKNGVIYMSFGTNTSPSMLPQEKIKMFVNVFSELPYDVLWKWDKDKMPIQAKKIRFRSWFPQSDLLRHPKVKLFITQGGLQSTDEAITAGVPLIGIPFLGDQWYNTEKYRHHGIGINLDFNTMNEDKLRKSIDDVVSNTRYRQNIRKLKELMHDQPEEPLKRAVWWTEHVIRHGGARHLRAPAANISWAQYLEIELILTLLLGLFVLISVIIVTLYLLIRYLRSYYVRIKVKDH